MRDHISFRPEKTELFVSPALTARTGLGDCDDSERLVRALASAANIRSRYVFATTQGSPTHVTVQLWDRGAWRWAEVTVPAYYDEHPLAALARLGIKRPDIDGDFVTMPPFPLLGSLASLKKTLGQVDLSSFTLPSYIDGGDGSAFLGKLVSIGVAQNPLDAIALLLHESGLNPAQLSHATDENGNPVAAGIFQLLVRRLGAFGFSLDSWTSLTALDQLGFWRAAQFSGKPIPLSGRDLYWVNFLPATYVPGASDDYDIVDADGTTHFPDGHTEMHPGFYSQNSGLDFGGKGFISAGDMALALQAGAQQHPKTFAYFAQLAGGGGLSSPSGSSAGIVAMLLGIGAGFAYEWLKRA